jgi:hypothetical protein
VFASDVGLDPSGSTELVLRTRRSSEGSEVMASSSP